MWCKTEWEKGNFKKNKKHHHVPFLPNEFTPSPSFFVIFPYPEIALPYLDL